MKKFNKFSLAALLAVGALTFGLASCDTAVDEKAYIDEFPTVSYSFESTEENDSSVTAKWEFDSIPEAKTDYVSETDNKWNFPTKAGNATWGAAGDEIANTNGGTGAKLTSVNLDKWDFRIDTTTSKTASGEDKSGKWGALNMNSNANADFTAMDDVTSLKNTRQFKVTLEKQSNIIVKFKGNTSAYAAYCGLGIGDCDADGKATKLYVAKGNVGNAAYVTLGLEKAPAGDYIIYTSGIRLLSIDCSYDSEVAKPSAVSSLKLCDAASNEITSITLEKEITATTVKQKDKVDDDGNKLDADGNIASESGKDVAKEDDLDADGNKQYQYQLKLFNQDDGDVTAEAVWTVVSGADYLDVDGGLVTLKNAGTAKVRARVGRFYKEVEVVVEDRHTITTNITDGDVLGVSLTKALEMNPSDAAVTVTPSNIATYANGVITGVAVGEAEVKFEKAEFTTKTVKINVKELEVVASIDLTKINETKTTTKTDGYFTGSVEGNITATNIKVQKVNSGTFRGISFTTEDDNSIVSIGYYTNSNGATRKVAVSSANNKDYKDCEYKDETGSSVKNSTTPTVDRVFTTVLPKKGTYYITSDADIMVMTVDVSVVK